MFPSKVGWRSIEHVSQGVNCKVIGGLSCPHWIRYIGTCLFRTIALWVTGQRHTEMLETIGGGNFWKDLSRWICTSHEEASGAEENDSAAVRLEVLELLSGRVMETGKAMK